MTLLTYDFPSPVGHTLSRGWRVMAERARPLVALIEDDPAIALMYLTQLEVDGYDVQLATDGLSGLHLVQTAVPDVILLDLRLPELPGLDVLRRVQEDPRVAHLPVLILSNYGEPAMIKEGLALGARDYLVKSQTTPDQLSVKLQSYVSGGTT